MQRLQARSWRFVADDYAGFDVAASKQRSLTWMALEGIDKTRIGRKSYWVKLVIPRLSSADDCWYRSQEACKKLRVTSCELSHLRTAGKLPFRKVGNAFLYRIDND